MEGGADVNFIDWGSDSLLASLALAVLVCPAVLALYRFALRRQLTPVQNRPSRLSVWFAMWALIFVCWTPYLLTFYPAGIVGDGALTLEEALTPGVPSSNHWVGAGHFDHAVFPVAGVADLGRPACGRVFVCAGPKPAVFGSLRGGGIPAVAGGRAPLGGLGQRSHVCGFGLFLPPTAWRCGRTPCLQPVWSGWRCSCGSCPRQSPDGSNA